MEGPLTSARLFCGLQIEGHGCVTFLRRRSRCPSNCDNAYAEIIGKLITRSRLPPDCSEIPRQIERTRALVRLRCSLQFTVIRPQTQVWGRNMKMLIGRVCFYCRAYFLND